MVSWSSITDAVKVFTSKFYGTFMKPINNKVVGHKQCIPYKLMTKHHAGIQLTHHEIKEIVQEVDDEGTGKKSLKFQSF
jgi:hypothetical protein